MELVSPRDISNESVKNNNKNPKTIKPKKKKIYHGPGLLKTEMDTNNFLDSVTSVIKHHL